MDYQTEADAMQEWQTGAEVEDHYRETKHPKVIWACPVCGGFTKNLYFNNQRLCVGFEDDGCGWTGKMRKNRKGVVYYPK